MSRLNTLHFDYKASGATTRTSGDDQPAKVLITVKNGIASFASVGNVAIHLVDYDCEDSDNLTELPPDFAKSFASLKGVLL